MNTTSSEAFEAAIDEQRFAAEDIVDHGVKILLAHGVPEADARLVAESLVTADVWGHPSHGMLRLPWYVARLQSGAMRAVTEVETISSLAAVSVLDGHDGIGQVVTHRAVTAAGNAANTYGVGVVAVRNSNHFGTAAYWTRILAEWGCVGILTTNGSPAMAPWGGVEKMVGANPWSIAVPGVRHGTVVLDIANVGVARGKVYAARQRGQRLPEGWAIDASGLPTTDPQAAIDGLILPMAGHKGYAISFMMDVLSGVLTGSLFGGDVVGPYVPDQRSGCGHLVIAIDVAAIMPPEQFTERVDQLIATVKSSRSAPGQEILVPGELENRAVATAAGTVTLPAKTIEELNALGAACGVGALSPER
jgi:LDH2 family malate/lactate/ureidoglycolate dehydrogenase